MTATRRTAGWTTGGNRTTGPRSRRLKVDAEARRRPHCPLRQRGTVTSIELDGDRRAGAWEVESKGKDGKEHDLEVDPKSGKVTGPRTTRTTDGDDRGR